MRFFLTLVIVTVFTCTISCQQYSAGLQKGSSRAEETSAIGTLRTIAQAQTTYSITNSGQYSGFEQLSEAGLLDSRFNQTNPELHGYVFTMKADGSYSCNADPAPTSNLGGRHFYIDSSGTEIRVNATQPATDRDEVLRP